MRLFIIVSIIILGSTLCGFAQTINDSTIKRSSLYAEAYIIRHDFSRGFVSINFERNIGKKQRSNFRLGIYPDFESAVSFPLTFTWLTKPLSNKHFEYGIGAVVRIERYNKHWNKDIPALLIPLMYRYQKDSGFFFRGGVNLFVSWPTLPSPSISFGYKF